MTRRQFEPQSVGAVLAHVNQGAGLRPLSQPAVKVDPQTRGEVDRLFLRIKAICPGWRSSCGRFHDGQYHAGHYRSVGSHPELRFDEDNVHKQCAPCNNHKSGDVVNYRINLVAKIGAAAVARLEGPHDARKWTVEEIKAIKALYRAKARDAKRAAA